MAEKLYTITELSALLNIAESTLRRYAQRHGKYLPCQGVGRKRRYLESSKSVFTRIADLYSENKTSEEVSDTLTEEYPVYVEAEEVAVTMQSKQLSGDAVAVLKVMAERIQSLEALVVERDLDIQELKEQLDKYHQSARTLIGEVKEEVATLKSFNEENQKELMEHLAEREKTMQELLMSWRDKNKEKKKPWWKLW